MSSTYYVLRKADGEGEPDGWVMLGSRTAESPAEAITQAAQESGRSPGGTYAAVAARNWVEQPVELRSEPRLLVGGREVRGAAVGRRGDD